MKWDQTKFFAILLIFQTVNLLVFATAAESVKGGGGRLLLCDVIPDSSLPVVLTYTSGQKERILFTRNLIQSLNENSKKLASNVVIACLDEASCDWCLHFYKNTKEVGCFCQEPSFSTTTSSSSVLSSSPYESPEWTSAVVKKTGVALALLQCSSIGYAVLADHDVVVRSSLDNVVQRFGHISPLITMCDFRKKARPENRMANTGFILVNTTDAKTREIFTRWHAELTLLGSAAKNDQPVFQEIVKLPQYSRTHACADEPEGLAMWFHKKGRLSGSGLSKQYYFEQQEKYSVFHANDIESAGDKIELLKELGFWYLTDDEQGGNVKPLLNESKSIPKQRQSQGRHNKKGMRSSLVQNLDDTIDEARNCSSSNKGKGGGGGTFYIYSWPLDKVDLVPRSGAFAARRENGGAGELIQHATGQFNTYMHSLFPIVLRRLLVHPARVLDPILASWFFIPFDVTSDAYYNQGQSLPFVLAYLKASPHFLRNQGANHFFIDSSEPFWQEKKHVVSSFYNFCSACLKFTPSTLPAPYLQWPHDFNIDCTYVHIPYTSTWHYHSLPLPPLSIANTTTNNFSPISSSSSSSAFVAWAWEFNPMASRKYMTCFVGIIRKMSPSATKLRRLLVGQCRTAGEIDANMCALRVLDKNSWLDFGNEATLYADTTFCLLPPGDIPSRKAVIDAMLAGCIPVLFDHRQISFYAMNILGGWNHNRENNKQQVSDTFIIFDPKQLPVEGVIKTLAAYSPLRIQSMRRSIRSVGWRLMYALPPPNAVSATLVPGEMWRPPQADALDVILASLGIL